MASLSVVTKQESEIYDRQIRLWGIEAQQRLQSSRMLLCGRFSATAAEVAKNLVLAVSCLVFDAWFLVDLFWGSGPVLKLQNLCFWSAWRLMATIMIAITIKYTPSYIPQKTCMPLIPAPTK